MQIWSWPVADRYEQWVHESDGEDYETITVAWLAVALCLIPLFAVVYEFV